jgi:hypothetical protein
MPARNFPGPYAPFIFSQHITCAARTPESLNAGMRRILIHGRTGVVLFPYGLHLQPWKIRLFTDTKTLDRRKVTIFTALFQVIQ